MNEYIVCKCLQIMCAKFFNTVSIMLMVKKKYQYQYREILKYRHWPSSSTNQIRAGKWLRKKLCFV